MFDDLLLGNVETAARAAAWLIMSALQITILACFVFVLMAVMAKCVIVTMHWILPLLFT